MSREQDASARSLPLPSKLLARLHEIPSSVFSSESHSKAVSLAIRERAKNGAHSCPRGPSHPRFPWLSCPIRVHAAVARVNYVEVLEMCFRAAVRAKEASGLLRCCLFASVTKCHAGSIESAHQLCIVCCRPRILEKDEFFVLPLV
jgi:hypothetical protein